MPLTKRRPRAMRGRKGGKRSRRSILRRTAVPRSLRANTLTIKRRFFLLNFAWDSVVTSSFWRYFQLTAANIPNFAEYQALFDEYRFNRIKYSFYPRYDSAEAGSAGSTGSPIGYAHVCVDPQSTLIPTGTYGGASLNQLMENSGVRTIVCNKPFSVYFRPKVLFQTSGTGTAAAVKTPGYYRTTETNAEHRGFHMYLQQASFLTSANANFALDVYVTVYMTLRNTR